MRNPAATRSRFLIKKSRRIALIGLVFLSLGAAAFLTSTSSAFRKDDTASRLRSDRLATSKSRTLKAVDRRNDGQGAAGSSMLPLMLLPQAGPAGDLVQIFAGDCTTPKSVFVLGETVCAKVSGGPTLAFYPRRISFVNNFNSIEQNFPITSDPQTQTFVLPSAGGTDYRGVWRVNSITTRSSVRASAFFTVSDPALPAADLAIYNSNDAEGITTAGSNVEHTYWFVNYGPDAAANVRVTNVTPANTTFSSGISSDPNVSCTFPAANSTGGTTTCTMTTLAAGAHSKVSLIFNVNPGTTAGTTIANTAHIASDTADPRDDSNTPPPDDPSGDPSNNTATSRVAVVSGAAGATCTLDCPDNIVAFADTTEATQRGAHVTFDAASSSGTCGDITASPASGSFFPVGTTTVNVTSSEGGGACSFSVTVEDTGANPPSISCPANKTGTANGSCEAAINLGNPTTRGDFVTVYVTRSDGKAMYNCDVNGENCTRKSPDLPFASGVTTVTWTAFSHSVAGPYLNSDDEESKRTGSASCTQTVTIDDITPPVIVAPANQSASADATCQFALPDYTTSATVSDNCACSSSDESESCEGREPITITQSPAAGTMVGLGPHTITLTANDGSSNNSGAGNTATVQFTVTVSDTTAPAISCPGAITQSTDTGLCTATVNPGTATASDNCDSTPTIVGVRSDSQSLSSPYPKGITTITWTATDDANNSSSCQQTITVNDTQNPTISCAANMTVYLPVNSTATSTTVNYTAPVGSDNCAGAVTTQTGGLASGASYPVGTTTNTFRVTDSSGNHVDCSFNVTVLYNFTGFFSPVNNLPVLNAVNAGRAIPVKFSLSGNKGLNIFAANNPYSVSFNCSTSDPGVDIVDTTTAGGSSLNYSPDTYNYVWKTESSWAGTCRQLVVTLNDGSVHSANFKFK